MILQCLSSFYSCFLLSSECSSSAHWEEGRKSQRLGAEMGLVCSFLTVASSLSSASSLSLLSLSPIINIVKHLLLFIQPHAGPE